MKPKMEENHQNKIGDGGGRDIKWDGKLISGKVIFWIKEQSPQIQLIASSVSRPVPWNWFHLYLKSFPLNLVQNCIC